MNKTIKQHFISRSTLKKWNGEDGNYQVYDTETNIHKKYNTKKYGNDPFHIDFFYEDQNLFELNEIENKLATLERELGTILKKIENKNKIILTRYETKFLRLYSIVDTYRSKAALDRAIKLDGGVKFNEYYSAKTFQEIKIEFLQEIHYLINDIYNYSKENIELLNEELHERVDLNFRKLQEALLKNTDIRNTKIVGDFKDRIASNISDLYIANTKFIKIPEDKDWNFLLTDATVVEYYGNIISQNFRFAVLYVKVLNPKLALAYIALSKGNSMLASEFTKDSFWFKMFPGLFVKDNSIKYFNEKKMDQEAALIPKNIEQQKLIIKLKQIKKNNQSNSDEYTFEPYILSNENQVNAINAMNLSQTSKFVIYINREDIKKARKFMIDNKITRIEKRGL